MTFRFAHLRFAFRACAALALCAVGLGASGCGGSQEPAHGGPPAVPGKIAVLNDCRSLRRIDHVELEGSRGSVAHYDVDLAPSESRAFDVDPDDYRIRVHWANADLFSYDESVGNRGFVQIQAVN